MSNNDIPDGVYNISNVKYTGYVVDLILDNPLGTISGFQLDLTNPPRQKVCTHSRRWWQKVTWWLTGSAVEGQEPWEQLHHLREHGCSTVLRELIQSTQSMYS